MHETDRTTREIDVLQVPRETKTQQPLILQRMLGNTSKRKASHGESREGKCMTDQLSPFDERAMALVNVINRKMANGEFRAARDLVIMARGMKIFSEKEQSVWLDCVEKREAEILSKSQRN